MAEVYWTEAARRDLHKLDKMIAQRIVRKISWVSNHFENIIPELLSKELKGAFKLRIGDWRVIYTIENDIMVIQFIGHRSEIYRRR